MSTVKLQFVGWAKNPKCRHYQNGVVHCNLDNEASCFVEIDEAEYKKIKKDHPGIFKKISNKQYENKMIQNAPVTKELDISDPEPEPEPVEVFESMEDFDLPDQTWTKRNIIGYMKDNDIPYNEIDTKAVLIEKIKLFME